MLRKCLKHLFGLGEWESLVWKHRVQGMWIMLLLAVVLFLLAGCAQQPKAETNVLPGKSSAKATTENVRPKEKSTRTITIRVTPPAPQPKEKK